MNTSPFSLLEKNNQATASSRAVPERLAEALNQQLQLEFESAYVYFGMATYFAEQNLDGFSKWFHEQAKEEMEHGMKIYNYLQDRDATVELPALPAPKQTYASYSEAVSSGLSQERTVSLHINELYGLAHDLRQFDTCAFLQWFLNEQVEEEQVFTKLLQDVERIEASASLAPLLILDKELASRTHG